MIKAKIYCLDNLASIKDKRLHMVAEQIAADTSNDIVCCVITQLNRQYIIDRLKEYNIWQNVAFMISHGRDLDENILLAKNRLLMQDEMIAILLDKDLI